MCTAGARRLDTWGRFLVFCPGGTCREVKQLHARAEEPASPAASRPPTFARPAPGQTRHGWERVFTRDNHLTSIRKNLPVVGVHVYERVCVCVCETFSPGRANLAKLSVGQTAIYAMPSGPLSVPNIVPAVLQ